MNKENLVINLKKYKQKKARLRIVNNEINKISKTITEIDADSNMSSQYALNSDIRSKNKVGNKVLAIVIEKENIDKIKQDNLYILEQEKSELEFFLEDIDARVSLLDESEKRLIIAMYFQRKTLTDVANMMYTSRTSLYRQHDKALEKMCKI